MAAYTGLTLRLKDRQTSVGDKLKLAKFAWVSEAVHIPNKHQFILDFVSGLLVNRKKHLTNDNEVTLVWNALVKFLAVAGAQVVIKPSILQTINESLSPLCQVQKPKSPSRKKDDTTTSARQLPCVLQCAKLVVGSPSVTASQFESMCHLLSNCLHISLDKNLSRDVTVAENLQELIEAVISALAKGQSSQWNQGQVLQTVADKLLEVSLLCLSQRDVEGLQQFLLSTLVQEEHCEAYNHYLTQVTGSEGQAVVKPHNKAVGNVFSILTKLVKQGHPFVAEQFIPKFMGRFVQVNSTNPQSCFLMLKFFMTALEDAGNRSADPSSKSVQTNRCSAVAACLSASMGCNFFDDTQRKAETLKWFCQLTEWVTEQPRESSWFVYMAAALQHNELIVEKYLVKVLTLGLVQSQKMSKESRLAQDTFLSELVSMYIQLRSTPALIQGILDAAKTAEGECEDIFCSLSKFKKSLSEMFQNVPSATLMDLWERIHDTSIKLVSEITSGEDTEATETTLHWHLTLYDLLLNHARLFDHRIAGIIQVKAKQMVGRLQQEVLWPLAQNKHLSKKCWSLQGLVSTWALVKDLLSPRWRETGEGDTVPESGDTKERKQESKLLKKADPTTRIRLSAHVEGKTVFDKTTTRTSTVKETELSCQVEDFVQCLDKIPTLTSDMVHNTWDGNVHTISANDQPTLLFQQFAQTFPLIGKNLSSESLQKCAELVVSVIAFDPEEAEKSPSDVSQSQTSLYSEVQKFLIHPATKESASLQAYLSSQVWERILSTELGSSHVNSPKKKKKKLSKDETQTESRQSVIKFLSSVDGSTHKCSVILDDWIGEEGWVCSNLQLLDILGEIPLEFLPEVNVKCQIGCLCLLALLRKGDAQLKVKVEQHLIRCLSVANVSQLFQCVLPSHLLDFATEHCSQGGDRERQVLSTCVEAVIKDRSAVPSVVQYAKNLVQSLRQDPQANSVKMFLASLIVKNTQRYMSFHIPELKEAALQIFFCLAKFVLRHGLAWLEKSSFSAESMKGGKSPLTMEGKKDGRMKKKRKRTNSINDEDNGAILATAESLKCWCALLNLMTEVLSMWLVDVADQSVNQALVDVSKDLYLRVMERLKSGSSPKLSQISEIQFITSYCGCHLRCSQQQSSPSTTSSSPSSQPDEDRDSSFSLLTSEELEQLWANLFSLAVAAFKVETLQDSLNSPTEACVQYEALDSVAAWPTLWTSHVDGLTAVMESSDMDLFVRLLENMLQAMNPSSGTYSSEDSLASVLVMLAVWRRLVNSNRLPEAQVQVWFKHMYQFLAVFLSLLQHYETFKTSTAHLSTTQTVVEEEGDDRLNKSASAMSRFVLQSISDFLDLGKRQVTARMALLCMQGAMTFTLTCPSDLDTVHRLLNALLVLHTNATLTAVPSVIHLVNKSLCACIQWGSEEKMTGSPQSLEPVLKSAHLVTRMLMLLSTSAFKSDLAKVAHNVIGEYVVEIQKGTVHTAVKRELLRGLYKLMSVSDKYRLASLHMTLPAGVKDTFKFLHQEYRKYHQYSGKA